ncbi:hypothetical protein B296_00036208 [Ensete ventricosum]|uniref:Uncharacterized protein n=1 Tax=Ensete ventricosum TaxID=4639 RepID=A0A426YHX1_ENSVE|nr:hypothetical protein B296_00036208 [Ensete ventricosum]
MESKGSSVHACACTTTKMAIVDDRWTHHVSVGRTLFPRRVGPVGIDAATYASHQAMQEPRHRPKTHLNVAMRPTVVGKRAAMFQATCHNDDNTVFFSAS